MAKRFQTGQWLCLLLLVGLVSCILPNEAHFRSRSNPINKRLISRIVKGKTTNREVISMFGQPTKTSTKSGRKILTYTFKSSGGIAASPFEYLINLGQVETYTSSQNLTVVLINNVVADYKYSETGNVPPM